jgi:predicted membrane-bound dolichyl-phosphate-mannose-protein mannosyltransferase
MRRHISNPQLDNLLRHILFCLCELHVSQPHQYILPCLILNDLLLIIIIGAEVGVISAVTKVAVMLTSEIVARDAELVSTERIRVFPALINIVEIISRCTRTQLLQLISSNMLI